MLPIALSLVVLAALITPQARGGRTGDPRLSSHLAGPQGARLLYELAARLGWTVSRRESPFVPVEGAGTRVHAVLAPMVPLTPEEAHRQLDAVRAGDGLLLVLDQRRGGPRREDALADSLGVGLHGPGGVLATIDADTAGCPARRELVPPFWADGQVHLYILRWTGAAPAGQVVFARAEPLRTPLPDGAGEMAVGFPLGLGRVVVVSDPDLLRNDVIRRCSWGADVRIVRMLEWLRAGGRTPRTAMQFDEFHQGFGDRASASSVSGEFLTRHPVGRAVLQIALAGLVLLLALAPRVLPPTHVERIERRDPLEQIDALAHAYEQVHATRTLTARLLRGVRTRVERGVTSSRHRDVGDFLATALQRDRSLEPDVLLVRRALESPLPERDLPELGAALHRIEHALTSSASG